MDDYGHIEEIDQYLLGKLHGAQLSAFEQRLADDQGFLEEVEAQRALRDAVVGAELMEVRHIMQADLAQQAAPKPNRTKWWGLGAGVLVVVALVTWIVWPTTELPKPVLTENTKAPIQEFSNTEKALSTTEKVEARSVAHQVGQDDRCEKEITSGVQEHPNLDSQGLDEILEKPDGKNVPLLQSEGQELTAEPDEPENASTEPVVEPVPRSEALGFNGRLKVTSSDYGRDNGAVILAGEPVGGVPPYGFRLGDAESQSSQEFDNLEPGAYTVFLEDSEGTLFRIGTITVDEALCRDEYNKGFSPVYDGTWEIPAVQDLGYRFEVVGQNGVVKSLDFQPGDRPEWDGTNNGGANAPAGYYRFEIRYENGKQCLGEITIGY